MKFSAAIVTGLGLLTSLAGVGALSFCLVGCEITPALPGSHAGGGRRDVPRRTADGGPSDMQFANAFTMVLIKTGPTTGLSKEQQQEAFAGHFSNMERLAGEGKLLMAGPFGEPRADPAHRGLWVFNTSDTSKALEWGATDPAVQMGIFVLEAYPLATDFPMRKLNTWEEEDEARRLADPDVPDEWEGRSYVLATHPWDVRTFWRVRGRRGVICDAVLKGHGPRGGDELIVWTDASSPEEARRILPDPDAWTLHGWYGSKMVEKLETSLFDINEEHDIKNPGE